jgi:uncharacterized protein YjbI with pentapeptide repeats
VRLTLQSRILLVSTILASAPVLSAHAQEQKPCDWHNESWVGSRKQFKEGQLEAKLEEQKKWFAAGQDPHTRTDFSQINLRDYDLSKKNLVGANLFGSFLMSANLENAHLNDSDLQCSVLTGADMTGAVLARARVRGANFEPSVNPDLRGMAQVKDLELLSYDDSSDALVQLANDFRKGGYDEQARKVTFAKRRRDTQRLWEGCKLQTLFHNCIEALFNGVFFDLTCAYGMRPGRTLLCVAGIWLICSFVYPLFMACPGPTGLYLVRSKTFKGTAPERWLIIRPRQVWKIGLRNRFFYVPRPELRVLRAAACFSLLSAFNVGFREFNIGQWLRLLMRREYNIKAVGPARTVAGVQSLISVYLVAIWLLTSFGHPFD